VSLLVRLLLLVLISIIPAVGLLRLGPDDLRSEREAQLRRSARAGGTHPLLMSQSVIEGAKELAVAISMMPSVAAPDPDAPAWFVNQTGFPAVTAGVAVFKTPDAWFARTLSYGPGMARRLPRGAIAAAGFVVGRYRVDSAGHAFLPLAYAFDATTPKWVES